MTVSVIEVASSTSLAGTAPTVALTTTPAAGDVVVVAHMVSGVATVTGASGLGATWTVAYQPAIATVSSRGSVAFLIGTGASASGTITVNRSDSRSGTLRAYLVRGLSDATSVGVDDNVTTSISSLNGTRQTAGAGQFVVAAFATSEFSSSAVPDWPSSASSPSEGAWSSFGPVYATWWTGVESHIPSSSGSVGTSASLTSARAIRITQLLVGTAGAGTPERASSATVTVGAGSSATAIHPRASGATVTASAGSSAEEVAGVVSRSSGATVTTSSASRRTVVPAAGGQVLEGGFAFGSALASSVAAVQRGLEAGFAFGSRLTQTRDWGTDPRSTRPSPSVVIARRDGTPVTALPEVAIGPQDSGVGVLDSWRFSVDRDNERGKLIDPVAHEALLYRGTYLMSKGPIGPGRLENGRMVYDVADPRWYLNANRIITRIPALNWVYNGDFALGTAGWTGAFKAGSIPEAKPAMSIVDEPESTSGKALRIDGVDKVVITTKDVETAAVFVANEATYLSGGEAILIAEADDIPDGAEIHIVGHTADRRAYGDPGTGLALSRDRAQAARVTLAAHNPTWTFSLLPGLKSPNLNDGVVAGRGYYEQVASNSTEPESAKNRRVALHYASTQTASGHRQYVTQRRYNVVNPVESLVELPVEVIGNMRIGNWLGAPADGYALRVVLVDQETGEVAVGADGRPIEATDSMTEATPRERVRVYSATVKVPPDGRTYYLDYELYPPAGWGQWFDIEVRPDEQLGFFDADLAHIVRDLTEFVQDSAYGHGDLGIGTRTPASGVTTTKEYKFSQLRPYGTAVEELTTLARGIEVDCEVTATTATIVTHYPRQGSVAGLTLSHGGSKSIIKAYRPLPASGRNLASNIIVQAWGLFSNRLLRYARDEAAFGGALLEAVIEADKESRARDLQQYADQQLAKSVHSTAAWEVVIDPARTSEVLDEIGKGDRVFLSLPDEGVHSLHRMVLRTWDPETDTLTLQLAPEGV